MKILKLLLLCCLFVECAWSMDFENNQEEGTTTAGIASQSLLNKAEVKNRLTTAMERGDQAILVIGAHPFSSHFGLPNVGVTPFYLDIDDRGKSAEKFESGQFIKADASSKATDREWISLFKESLDIVTFDERVLKYLHATPLLFQQFLTMLKVNGSLHIDVGEHNEFSLMELLPINYCETETGLNFGRLERDEEKQKYVLKQLDFLEELRIFYNKNKDKISTKPYMVRVNTSFDSEIDALEEIERRGSQSDKEKLPNWEERLTFLRVLKCQFDNELKSMQQAINNVYKLHVQQWFLTQVLAGMEDRYSVEMLDAVPYRENGGICASIKRIF